MPGDITIDVMVDSADKDSLSGTQYRHDDKDGGKREGQAEETIDCIAQQEQRKPNDEEGKDLDQAETKSCNETLFPIFLSSCATNV